MKRFLTIIGIVLMGTFAAQAGFLTNLDLDGGAGETGSLFGNTLPLALNQWDVFENSGPTAIPGWIAAPNGIEVQNFGNSDSGDQHVELDTHTTDINNWLNPAFWTGHNSSMSQSFTIGAGGYDTHYAYVFKFAYKIRTDRPPTDQQKAAHGGLSTFAIGVYVTGTGLGPGLSYIFDDETATDWTTKMTPMLFLGEGSYTLTFAALGLADAYGGLIDTIEFLEVPEPATYGLVGIGLMGLYFIRRRRRA